MQNTNKTILLEMVLWMLVGPACAASSPKSTEAKAAPAVDARGAREQCARGAPEPVIARKDLRAYKFEKQAGNDARETVVLDDGTALSIRHSGCAHYSLELTFTLAEQVSSRSPGEWLIRAAELMSKVSAIAAHEQSMQRAAETLQKNAGKPYGYGEGLVISEMETVNVNATAATNGTLLAVIYDVAL